MAEIFSHTDEDGYRVAVTTGTNGDLMVSAFPVHDFNRISAVDLPVTDGRRLLAVLERHYAGAVPEHLVGDGPCHDCGAVNIRWYADSPLWNLVMGGPDATDDPGGIVCVHCFVKRADAAGFNPSAWRLSLPVEDGAR